jgi:ankyrin repeat protein
MRVPPRPPNRISSIDGVAHQPRSSWEVERLVEEAGIRLNARGCRGRTALMLATWRDHEAVVERLLALGADVGLRDSFGQTAVHWACMGNRTSNLALLLDSEAPINARSTSGKARMSAWSCCWRAGGTP